MEKYAWRPKATSIDRFAKPSVFAPRISPTAAYRRGSLSAGQRTAPAASRQSIGGDDIARDANGRFVKV